METAIILLAAACFILSGALTWLWLSGRAETRAEYRRELDRAAPPRPRAGLINRSQPGCPWGSPGHPDRPVPPPRQAPRHERLHSVIVRTQTGGMRCGSHGHEQKRDLSAAQCRPPAVAVNGGTCRACGADL